MSHKLSHQELLDHIDAYVHGALEPDLARQVEAFCETQDEGRAALEKAQARQQLLNDVAMVEAPESLIRSTLQKIDGTVERRARLWKWYFRGACVLVAASVMLVAGLHSWYAQLAASPYDLHIYGQSELLSGSDASLRVGLFDRKRDAALSGIPVEVTLVNQRTQERLQIGEFTTDEQGSGSPRIELPDWPGGTYELQVLARPDGDEELVTRTITLKRASRLLVTTDKPLYQPGQTIHMRALALRRPDLQPVRGEQAVLTVTDPKGNRIFQKSTPTSEYGIVATDCALALEILEGEYTIGCRVGEVESQRTVKVERYVLPKFRVQLSLDQPFYAPGEKISGSVQADYFFGKPVAGGTVEVALYTHELGPYQEQRVSLKTDPQGHGKFELPLPETMIGREELAGAARAQLIASVTDSAEQSYQTARAVIVTEQPILIEVLPEAGTLVAGVENRVYVVTSYADGRPAEAQIDVSGHQQPLQTSPMGVASFSLTPQDQTVRMTIRATDSDGRIGRRHVTLAAGTASQDFLIRTDRAVYEGGDTLEITALGGKTEPVFVDLLKDGQTVLTRMIEINEARGELNVDLPAGLSGTLQLCAYRFGPTGLPMLRTRTLFVQPASELQITAKLDEDEYRPGEQARLSLQLRGPDGKPVPGAISLSAVDEAVYSVLQQRPGLEQTFFQLEQELLQPVYAIYGAWQPQSGPPRDVPLAQQREWEQALFAATAAPVNGPAGPGGIPFDQQNDVIDVAPMVQPMMMDEIAAEEPVAGRRQPAASPLTLSATTWPQKVAEVAGEKRRGLRMVETLWWSILGGTVLIVLAGLAIFRTRMFLYGAAGVTAFAVLGIGFLVVAELFFPGAKYFEAVDTMATRQFAVGMAMAEGADMEAMPGMVEADLVDTAMTDGDKVGTAPPRVRQWFPETLLWRPEVITDERGEASIEIPLADSITTWRVDASAVSGTGQLGATRESIRVFQPFFVDLNLPVALTRNDEVAVPAVVYNHLDEPQTVELTLAADEWFELVDPQEPMVRTVEVPVGEPVSVSFRVRAKQVGQHRLEVTARAAGVADAIRRDVDVVPDGRRVEVVSNGSLDRPAEVALEVPENVIPGSITLLARLYPSGFSQLVEGLDGIFQRPSGCFEQTSSTTYPNVLALQYLRDTGKSVPEVEAKARQYIHLGYQRLLSFEVAGQPGGFDWFGNPPANLTLSAYGLMEFTDMARVHDVDPDLISRTRRFVLSQRRPDGVWPADRGMLNDGLAGAVQRGDDLDLTTTAYVAWACFAGTENDPQAQVTLDYLLSHPASGISDPYTLALMANAIQAIKPRTDAVQPYLNRLDGLKKSSGDGKQSWWELGDGSRTTFYSSGRSGDVEVTALAALAMQAAKSHSATVRGALSWLVAQRDGQGTWHSTQATIIALKALIGGTSAAAEAGKPREIAIELDGQLLQQAVIPADQSEVMQQLNLSSHLQGTQHTLTLRETTDTATGYQVLLRYHVPGEETEPEADELLKIDVTYDRTSLTVDESVLATARVTNQTGAPLPMVIVDLPIPPGFELDTTELKAMRDRGQIAKFQLTPRSAVLYLRDLSAGDPLAFEYRLRATLPVKATAPAAVVYEYYTPENRAASVPLELTVDPRAF